LFFELAIAAFAGLCDRQKRASHGFIIVPGREAAIF
jgi:hypothetical protein